MNIREKHLHKKIALFIFLVFVCISQCNDCDLNLKLTQNLLNDGFHRNLTYELNLTGDSSKNWLNGDCTVAIDQTLPPGVYVNADEIDDLKRMKKMDAVLKNAVNIELPTELSSESYTLLFGQVKSTNSSFWIPVHARYHKAVAGKKLAENQISHPKLYLRCDHENLLPCNLPKKTVKFLCNSTLNEMCEWKAIKFTLVSSPVSWEVPVGNMDHYYLVSSCTAIVIVMGSIYLLKEIHNTKIRLIKKNM